MIDFQFEKINRSDIDLNFADERGLAGILEARRLPGVDHAEPVLDVSCTFVHGSHRKRGGITGLLPECPADDAARSARATPSAIPPNGLAMSREMADDPAREAGRHRHRPAGQRPPRRAANARRQHRRHVHRPLRLRRHPLPQPPDRRRVGHQRRASHGRSATRDSGAASTASSSSCPSCEAVGARGEVIANLQTDRRSATDLHRPDHASSPA